MKSATTSGLLILAGTCGGCSRGVDLETRLTADEQTLDANARQLKAVSAELANLRAQAEDNEQAMRRLRRELQVISDRLESAPRRKPSSVASGHKGYKPSNHREGQP